MAHYFDENNNVKSEEKTIHANINNKVYTFKTDNNVFSKKGLDFGTRTLLETIDLSQITGDVLDIGCGYGPIGIYFKSNTDSNVDMVDINERAINLARKNALLNQVDVNIYKSNMYENIDKKYDYIITNPPIRVGKKILYQILFDAKKHLNKSGHLIFVINKDQGAKSTARDLEKEYAVNILNKNKGFYIIDCQNR